MAAYVVSQYVSCQKSSYQRSASSWNWIYRGWLKSYNAIRHGVRGKIEQRDAWISHLKGFKVKILDRGVRRFLSPGPILNIVPSEQAFIDSGIFSSGLAPPNAFFSRLLARCEWIE
jgi:hypothetical protein